MAEKAADGAGSINGLKLMDGALWKHLCGALGACLRACGDKECRMRSQIGGECGGRLDLANRGGVKPDQLAFGPLLSGLAKALGQACHGGILA